MRKHRHLRLTVLCENVVGNLSGIGEHGLAIYIETESGVYLFDTGQGAGILHNSLTFGKDLRKVRKIFLSHGHYDHTGGLSDVLKIRGSVDVHCHPAVFGEKYAISQEGGRRYIRFIGVPHARALLESRGGVFNLSSEFSEVDEGMYTTGEIPRLTSFETGDTRLHVKRDGDYVPDAVPDDGALVILTEKGLVVILGCAHAGTINTLEHILARFPGERIYTLIGGTHWGFLPEDAVDTSIKRVKEMGIGTVGVCHCTGIAVASKLARELGKSYFYASVGTVFEL